MASIKKLDQNLVDQIAAGEVVERPASVVKELVENAIDAEASKIEVKIRNGGKSLIQISDDGVGMSPEDLQLAPQSHTTSKIEQLEDIIRIKTLGFRGEALSSIASVSKMTLLSLKDDADKAYQISVEGGDQSELEIATRNRGTTIKVQDLFFNVPARRKFLKTDKTEYRKILQVFMPIALINPQIHLVLESDDRVVYNLPPIKDVSQGSIHPDRLAELFKDTDFVELFYDGEGITVGGVVAHPKHHKSRTRNRFVFVNGRPVWDSGIVKAVSVGANRFIPATEKIPFAISVNATPQHVDVNVHPQKSEVRFSNPYRIYSAVEKAVKAAYEQKLKKNESDQEYSRFRKDGVRHGMTHTEAKNIDTHKVYNSDESLRFSRMLLEDSAGTQQYKPSSDAESKDAHSAHSLDSENQLIVQDSSKTASAAQFLNRYIVTEGEGELWIIDQHAAAERIRFEKLLKSYQAKQIDSQMLMPPVQFEVSEEEASFIEENIEILDKLGYSLDVKKTMIQIKAVPSLMQRGDHREILSQILDELREYDEFANKDGILQGKYRDSIIATMACHSSVRMNRRLASAEVKAIVKDLMACQNSYSCPHGRPIMWKLSPREIEKHFER